MEPRYTRNIPALTEAECLALRKKRVLVIGCGGLGGHIIDMLSRIGIGFLRVVDGDVFEPSNLNRQLLSEMSLLGTGKAAAAADHIHRVNPDVAVEFVPEFMTEENVCQLVADCDIVMDALDSISDRKILASACRKAGIPYVYGAIQGWVTQAAVFMPDYNPMDILFPEDTEIRDNSVLAFTPAFCASMQVSLCVKLLTGQYVETGTIYYFDLLNQEYETIPLAASF